MVAGHCKAGPMHADQVKALLGLEPNPSCGFTVGDDLVAGERPQLLVPAQTFHVSRVKPGGAWALLGTTVFPGLEPTDVELGDLDELAGRYPAFATEIRTFGAAGR